MVAPGRTQHHAGTKELFGFALQRALHVGDDPERDWKAAADAGLSVFKLERPKNSLRDLIEFL